MMNSTQPDGVKRCESNACVQVDIYTGVHLSEPLVRLHSTATGTVMQVRASEWHTFVQRVKAGDFDPIAIQLTDTIRAQRAAEHGTCAA